MAKNSITNAYNSLPRILLFIIHLFLGSLVSGLFRIIRFFETKNVVTLVVGILALVTGIGNLIFWIIDLVTIIFKGGITVCAA